MLKNRRPVIAVILVAILLGGGGFWLWRAPSETGNVLTLYGNIDIREVQPAFNDSGRIASVSVHEGVAVKRGQLLATLDDSRYAAALAQARAQMQARKQTLERLQAGSRPEEIAEAKAKMDALEAAHRNAEIVYKRYANLTVRNAASRQQLDDARAAAAVAFHQYEAAKQTYLLVKMGPRQEDIAAAREIEAEEEQHEERERLADLHVDPEEAIEAEDDRAGLQHGARLGFSRGSYKRTYCRAFPRRDGRLACSAKDGGKAGWPKRS